MSGSIMADRIPHSAVQSTLDSFRNILKSYPAFVSLVPTGSTTDSKKQDHGDIDVSTFLKGEDIKQVKKDFMAFLNSLPDNVTVPFRGGRNQGKKCMMYADIVTCQIPVVGFEGLLVQIDNAIVLSELEQVYKKSFLDLPGEKQALLMGIVRVILKEENPEDVFKRMHINVSKLPKLEKNQGFEFVLAPTGVTLRKVTLDDSFKEVARETIWQSHNWSDVETLLKGYDLSKDFDSLLADVQNKGYSTRSKRRIVGILNSVLVIGPGEQGKPKGDNKQRAKDRVIAVLGEVEQPEETKTVALYGGGFKPPHKAHFANAQRLAKNADRLIIIIGQKVREGVPITAEQSKAVWEIYKQYIDKPVEIRISNKTPISDIYEIVGNPELKDIQFIVGKSEGAEEDKKFAYLLKNSDKFTNCKLQTLPIVVDKEDNKLSATTLRQSLDKLKKGEWIPRELGVEDTRRVLNIVLKPLRQSILQEDVKSAINMTLASCVGSRATKKATIKEGSSGTPISFSSVISSASRAKLQDLYWKLQTCLRYPTEIDFKQSFILVSCNPKLQNLVYDDICRVCESEFNVERYGEGMVKISVAGGPLDTVDIGSYRTDANREDNLQEECILNTNINITDWVKHAAGLISYMRKNGMSLDPLPDIIINREKQEPGGLLIKTADYNPVDKVITVYTAGRAFKDAIRSLSHELVHSQQDIDGKIGKVNTDRITDEDITLNNLEREAYEKGNMMFRGYVESLK